MKRHLSILLAIAALLSCAGVTRADDASSPESRLRDALKKTILQLRTSNEARDAAQAAADDEKTQLDALKQQFADLTKKSAADSIAETKTMNVLKAEVSDQQVSIANLQAELEAWKKSQRQAVEIANATEAKRAKLADLSIHLQRTVDDQKRKNDGMYKIGMEVLDRYEKFGLGQALVAKEPFVGITRAKFETLVQDSEDELNDQRITDEKSPSQKPKQ